MKYFASLFCVAWFIGDIAMFLFDIPGGLQVTTAGLVGQIVASLLGLATATMMYETLKDLRS
jgi:hypothetical protein